MSKAGQQSGSVDKYESCELEADDVCLCGHRRDEHDYSKYDSIAPDRNCIQCNCPSWNMDYHSEFILPLQRLFWRIFKGYKTSMIISKSLRVQPFTKAEIEAIKKEFCT